MRDVQEAWGRGARATLRAIAGLPRRHPLTVAGFCTGLAVVLFFAGGLKDTRDRVDSQRTEIQTIHHVVYVCRPSQLASRRQSAVCANRLELALLNCREHAGCREALIAVDGPASAVPTPASAKAGQQVEASLPEEVSEGGGAQNPGQSGQQPGGGGPPSSPPPSPAPEGRHPEAPPSSNGNGDQGATAQPEERQGVHVEACVGLVGKCVEVGLEP